MSQEPKSEDAAKKRVVYNLPGADVVVVRQDVEFRGADGGVLAMDLYYPADASNRTRAPAAVVVAGYPDEGFQKIVGCRFKQLGSSVSWGRLIAASGIIAITYANREPVGDLRALLEYVREHADSLGIDPGRVGIWASSGNVPLALSLLMERGQQRATCAVLCYGYMLDLDGATGVADAARMFKFVNPAAGTSVDDLPRDLPLFIARAGEDRMPRLNESLDRFVAGVLASNLPITFTNHAAAPHAFDLYDDSETSREIIRQILRFLQFHLLATVDDRIGADSGGRAVHDPAQLE
jgi:hypothetical protein